MKNILRKLHRTHQAVPSSLFDQNTFYETFRRDLEHAKREVIIESPFISVKRTKSILAVIRGLTRQGVRVAINTRDPREHDEPHQAYAYAAIALLQNAGVIVLYTGGHHRKLAIIDEKILWEGSLNILSHYDSCEIMRRMVSNDEALRMKQFIKIAEFLT